MKTVDESIHAFKKDIFDFFRAKEITEFFKKVIEKIKI